MTKMRWILLCAALVAIGASAMGRTFSDAGLGYSIDVPEGWQITRPSSTEVRLSGGSGAAASAVFSIQNVASTSMGGQYADVGALTDSLKCQLVVGAGDICIYLGDPMRVRDASGNLLQGTQLITEYAYGDTIYKEWLSVVPHGSGDLFYVVTYTIPRANYDAVEPAILDMLATWRIGEPATDASGSTPASSIRVLLEDRGHIGPYDYAAGAYDKRLYQVTVPSAGYVALCVVDEPSQSISGWILTLAGETVVQKPGNAADVYTGSYAVAAGIYGIKVGQDTMVTESDFELYVYFSTEPFTIDDLVSQFGPRVRTL